MLEIKEAFRKLSQLFLVVIVSSSVYANKKQPALEQYVLSEAVSLVRMSPNGELLAFKKHQEGADYIMIVTIDGKKLLKTLALDHDVKASNLYFISDHKLIIQSAEYRKVSGVRKRYDVSTAFVLDIKSGELRQLLIPGKVVYKWQKGLGYIVGITHDGKHALLPAYVPKSSTDENPNYSLVRASLTIEKSPKVILKGKPYTLDYFVDSLGSPLAEIRYDNELNLFEVISYYQEKGNVIFSKKLETPNLDFIGVTEDNASLVFIEPSDKTEYDNYSLMNLQTGKISPAFPNRRKKEIAGVIANNNRVVYGVKHGGFQPSYSFLDKNVDHKVANILADLPDQSVYLIDWTKKWNDLVIYIEGPQSSGDYFLLAKDKPLRHLASARPQIPASAMSQVVEINYPAADGLTIPALLTIPQKYLSTMSNMPTIVMPHGGPHANDTQGYDWLAQALASRGYLIVQPQFRGSTGFGLSHLTAGYGEWGKKMQSDVDDGVKALVKEKFIDPSRVCIVGASYGGYAALAAGAFNPDTYRCIASINGISDISKMMEYEVDEYGDDHWLISYWNNSITAGDDSKDQQLKVSPAEYANQFKAPTLLIHSERDKVVSIEQSEYMAEKLKKAKKDVQFFELSDEDHYLSKESSRKTAIKTIVEFVDKHIGG